MKADSAASRVINKCLALTKGKDIPWVFIEPKLFDEFAAEVDPVFKEQFGAPVEYWPALMQGFQSRIYQGWPIIRLPMEWPE